MPSEYIIHNISLGLDQALDTHPVEVFGEPNTHRLRVRIYQGGEALDLSNRSPFELKIERVQNAVTGTLLGDNKTIEFAINLATAGWSICSVLLDNGASETQRFQIYREDFVSVPVDESSFAGLTQLTDQELLKLITLAQSLDISQIQNVTSILQHRDKLINLLYVEKIIYNGTQIQDTIQNNSNYLNNGTLTINSPVTDVRYRDDNSDRSLLEQRVAYIDRPVLDDVLTDVKIYRVGRDNNNATTALTAASFDINNRTLKLRIPTSIDYITVNESGPLDITTDDTTKAATVNINTLDGFRVNNTDVSIKNPHNSTSPNLMTLSSGNGITLTGTNATSDNNGSVSIAFNPNTAGIHSGNITWDNAHKDYIAVINENNQLVFKPREDALGIDITDDNVYVNYDISEAFRFDDFRSVQGVNDTDQLPFIRPINTSGDISGYPAFSTHDTYQVGDIVRYTNPTTGVESLYTCIKDINLAGAWDDTEWIEGAHDNIKITWADLMSQFNLTHRTEYIPVTINSSAWVSGTNSCVVTIDYNTLASKNLTTAMVLDEFGEYNTHANIYPASQSLPAYVNGGVYCASISGGSGGGINLGFVKNATVSGNIDVIVEVRL